MTLNVAVRPHRLYKVQRRITYSRILRICNIARPYDRKIALVAADMLRDHVLRFYEEQRVPLRRITDRGAESTAYGR
jgi:hypothetical protein